MRLQVFTVVSRGFPFIGGFPALALARGWPLDAVRSPWTRALFQIDRLTEMRWASGAVLLATTPAGLARAEREGPARLRPRDRGRPRPRGQGRPGGRAVPPGRGLPGPHAPRPERARGLVVPLPGTAGARPPSDDGCWRPWGRTGSRSTWRMPRPGCSVRCWNRPRPASSAPTPGWPAWGRGGATSTTPRSAASPTGAGSSASSSGPPTWGAGGWRRWPTTWSTRCGSRARRQCAWAATSTVSSRCRPGCATSPTSGS